MSAVKIDGPHCSACGSTDREDTTGGHGYTHCCNKTVCDGGPHRDRFGTEEDHVYACCWGVARMKFDVAGRDVPDGSCRLP